jgi:hypothetical protein
VVAELAVELRRCEERRRPLQNLVRPPQPGILTSQPGVLLLDRLTVRLATGRPGGAVLAAIQFLSVDWFTPNSSPTS